MASFLVNKFSRKKVKKMNDKKIKYDFEQNMEDLIFSLFSYSSLVQETKESLKIAGKKLGNLGWTVPEELPIPFLTEIVEEQYTDEKIQKEMIDFFDENRISNMLDRINKSLPQKYQQIYKEIYFNILNENYIASYTLSIILFEGLLAGTFKDKKEVCTQAFLGEIGKKIKEKEEKYVGTIYAQLKSLTSFNEKLYGTKDFNKIEEDIINRNILFHGRGFNIGKIEVIQMANAIESVCSICEIINSVEK